MSARVLATYDFTLKRDDLDYVYTDIINCMKERCKKWAFQLEKSDSGYEHYQGRFILIKKTSIVQCIKLFHARFSSMHIQPTSNASSTNFTYVMKEQTRLDGPWTDKDPDIDEVYVPIQYRVELRPWQDELYKLVMKELEDKHYRNVHVLYDPTGGIGKTTMALNLTCRKKAEYIPPCNDAKDIMRMCFSLPTTKLYIFDLTRSMCKDKLYGMYSAIEQIKNGYIYDDRYSFRRKFIDAPGIIIMTNTLPTKQYLVNDRWRVHMVEGETLKSVELQDDDFGLDD